MAKFEKDTFYTVVEIAEMFNITKEAARSKLTNSKIKKVKTDGGGFGLYSSFQVDKLRERKGMVELFYEKAIEKSRAKPTIITYYIYESKMNRDE